MGYLDRIFALSDFILRAIGLGMIEDMFLCKSSFKAILPLIVRGM